MRSVWYAKYYLTNTKQVLFDAELNDGIIVVM